MKKHSLFKVILIVLGSLIAVDAVLAILGVCGVKGLKDVYTMIPLGDVLINFVQSFYYFFDTVVYLLVLGAFYGVLNKVPAYKKLVDNVAQKVKSNSKLFVFIITGIFAVLTSLTGLTNVLLIFVPFAIAIILLLGYDKLVAISSTIVAMLVGFMGGIYVTFRDPSNYYGYSATTIEGLTGIELSSTIWFKLAILVFGTALLIFFINRYINNVKDKKVKYELNENDSVVATEVKGDYKEIRTWPMIAIFAIIFVILLLGLLPWNSLFGITCFDSFNEWLLGLKIGEFTIFSNIISNNMTAFGNWASLGSYMSIIITLILFTLLIKFIYKVKFNDVIDNFVSGSKKMVPMIFIIILSYAILVSTYNHGFIANIINWLNDTKLGINVVTASLITMLGTLLHSDLYYTIAGVYSNIIATITDKSLMSLYAITFQSVYGLTSIIAPTSFLVIFALKYFDVPYTTWVKYIWRFVLMLFLLVILVLLVLALV